jgi:hypothetical protein
VNSHRETLAIALGMELRRIYVFTNPKHLHWTIIPGQQQGRALG